MDQENNKISHLEAISREPKFYYVKSSSFGRIWGKYAVIGRIMLWSFFRARSVATRLWTRVCSQAFFLCIFSAKMWSNPM